MVPCFSSLSSLACESCQLGKHTRVSFPKRLNNRAKSPFELVHTDVWGPCRTASTLGFQLFCHFHWWLFSMYLVIFNEKSSWVILYFSEILCWNLDLVQYFYSCVTQWQCQGIFFNTIYFVYVSSWDSSPVFLCSYFSTKWGSWTQESTSCWDNSYYPPP